MGTKEDTIDFIKKSSGVSGIRFENIDLSNTVIDFPVDFTGANFYGSTNFSHIIFKEKSPNPATAG